MRHLLLLTSLRHLARHKLRTLLTLLGIITGVTTFVFAPALAATISQSIRAAVEETAGKTSLEIRGDDEGFHRRALNLARLTEGVAAAAPFVQTGGVLLGETQPLAFLGIDPAVDQQVRAYDIAAGHFLNRAGGVLLSQRYAADHNVRVGQLLRLIGSGGTLDARVVGLLAPIGMGRLNSGDVVVMRYQDAQALRADQNLDSIAILPAPDQEVEVVGQRLRQVLPSLEVNTPQTRRSTLDDIQGVITFIMSFVSIMILAVGSTLVYNTMAVAVAQRRFEIGVLRALGVPRAHIQRMFVLEASVLGLIGSTLGVVTGVIMVNTAGQALNLNALFTGTLLSDVRAVVPAWLLPVAFLAGVLVPTLAGYLPSRQAARVDPLEALTETRADTGSLQLNRRRAFAAGLLLLLCLLSSVTIALTGRSAVTLLLLLQTVTTVLLFLAAVILLLPAILSGTRHFAPRLMQRLFGVAGLLAAQNVSRRPRRMIATAALLTVAAWAGIVSSASNFGYRDFVDEWNQSENIWDLTISGPGSTPFKPVIGLPPQLLRDISTRREVAATIPERLASLDQGATTYEIRAVDVAQYRAQHARLLWDTGDEVTAYNRLRDVDHPAILLTGFAAFSHGLKVGDTLTLNTPGGQTHFEIVGTVLGTTAPARAGIAGIVMDLALYRRLWRDHRLDRLLIKLQPGVDAAQARRALQDKYTDSGVVIIRPADLSAAVNTSIGNISGTSQMFSFLLAVTIVAGVANTFVIVVLDRRREMGILRALGLKGRQIALGLILETVLIVTVAVILALPVSIFNNYLNTLTLQGLMSVRFTLTPSDVAATVGLMSLAAISATYFPARQASRVDVLEALHYE